MEQVYENAMIIELKNNGLYADNQVKVNVYYEGENVGDYFADLVVEGLVIVELKACESVIEQHEAQLLNYLKATEIEVGLLLNFGKLPQVKRKAFSNKFK